jgi:chromosome segregation ATPase
MPIFGHSERDLDKKYKRGVRDGRSQGIRELLNELSRLFPNLAHRTSRNLCPDTSDIIRYLTDTWQQEQSVRSRQHLEIEFLKRERSRLEAELEILESGKLHTTIENLTVERHQLRQRVATLQNELSQLQLNCDAERQELLEEIEQLDELVVHYESETQNSS